VSEGNENTLFYTAQRYRDPLGGLFASAGRLGATILATKAGKGGNAAAVSGI